MRQKMDEYYRNTVMKARKSEKALRQVQRQAYAEMITCATKTYDQYKECVDANMGLFELDSLTYEELADTAERIDVSKALIKGTFSLDSQDLFNAAKTESQNSTEIASSTDFDASDGGRNRDVSIASSVPYTDSVADVQDLKANACHKNMNVTSDKDIYRKSNSVTCVSKSDIAKPIKLRALQITLTSPNETEKPKKYLAKANKNGIFQNIRKRKREIDDLKLNRKTDHANSETLPKKTKIDTVHVHSNVSKTVVQLPSCIPIVSKKRKRDTSKKASLKAISNAQVACKRSKLAYDIDKFVTVDNKSEKKDHIVMQTHKEPQENKWIECKVNHPIKQSKSKIPLPIHKLGCKNDSNLAAHLKRIGAYNRMKLIEPYSSRLLSSKVIDKI